MAVKVQTTVGGSSQTFSDVKENVTNEELLAFGQAVGSVMANSLEKITKTETDVIYEA